MASTGVETRILEALDTRLQALVFSPAIPISFPNRTFTPSGAYLRTWWLPSPTETLGGTTPVTAPLDYKGIYQVSVFWPIGSGSTPIMEVASAIAAHFKRGTKLSHDGIDVWMDDPPSVGPMIQESNVLQLPVSVPYRAFVPSA